MVQLKSYTTIYIILDLETHFVYIRAVSLYFWSWDFFVLRPSLDVLWQNTPKQDWKKLERALTIVHNKYKSSLAGSYLGQITFRKQVGAKNSKHPSRDIKYSESRNNWQRLNVFKTNKVKRKIGQINVLIDMQINLSLCRTSDHYFLLSL